MPRFKRASWGNLLYCLSAGYIVCFFSERLFWTVLWPDSTSFDLVLTWLAYSAIAYLFLAAAQWSAANDWASMFLTGAIFGWLAEGGLANTLYGGQASAPFPWSISLTGLSWHATLTVMIGWWGTQKALAAQRTWPLALLSSGIGVFWGLWAMFPLQENPPVEVSIDRFALQAFGFTGLLIASWATLSFLGIGAFRTGWLGASIAVLGVGVFYSQHAAALGWPALLLPLLLGCTVGLLSLNRGFRQRTPTRPRALLTGWRLALPLLAPTLATCLYMALPEFGGQKLPVAPTLYGIAGPAGFMLYFLAAGHEIRLWLRQRHRPS